MPKKSKVRRWFISIGLMIVAAPSALAGDVKIIANPSVQANSITTAELKGVFLLQRKTLAGSLVAPVLQKGSAHEAFLSQYLERSAEEIETYYQGLVFTGKGFIPKQLNSDAEVVSYVAKTQGAIGYVSSSANSEGLKILAVVSDPRQRERKLLARVEPDYPQTLQRAGIGGTVRLELTISPRGTVEAVSVLGGNPILAEAAAKAARQWVYSPWPVRTTIQVSLPFTPKS
jgi:TonB family protein